MFLFHFIFIISVMIVFYVLWKKLYNEFKAEKLDTSLITVFESSENLLRKRIVLLFGNTREASLFRAYLVKYIIFLAIFLLIYLGFTVLIGAS